MTPESWAQHFVTVQIRLLVLIDGARFLPLPSKTKKVDEKRNARREALGAMARTRVPPTYLEKVVQVKIPNPHDIPQAEQIHILPDNKGVLHT